MGKFDFDVVIIGSGVTGCAVARELSRYQLNICVVEKNEDVCTGASKANSGIVHAGYDAENGTLKQKLNLLGNKKMEQLAKDLDFEFVRNGAFVLCFDPLDMPSLENLYQRGIANGVEDLILLSGDEVRKMESSISTEVVAALYAPTSGIVCPFGLTIALAENAFENGVAFKFNAGVTSIKKRSSGYELSMGEKTISSQFVVNAAGVYADVFHNMVSQTKIEIEARKGDYCLLDKTVGNLVSKTIFQLPTKLGKGILVTPTVHGNLLIGPTVTPVIDKENNATTAIELATVMEKACKSVKDIPFRQVITAFSGLRAHEKSGDFVIGEISDAPGFFDVAGIESPGLSCSPAIGEYVAEMVAKKASAAKKAVFKNTRKGMVKTSSLNATEFSALIKERPEFGTMVCRCENITEGEIIDSIHRPLGATTLDGVKRRVRAGMGRCQAGFCTAKTMEILARELHLSLSDICKNGPDSQVIKG